MLCGTVFISCPLLFLCFEVKYFLTLLSHNITRRNYFKFLMNFWYFFVLGEVWCVARFLGHFWNNYIFVHIPGGLGGIFRLFLNSFIKRFLFRLCCFFLFLLRVVYLAGRLQMSKLILLKVAISLRYRLISIINIITFYIKI